MLIDNNADLNILDENGESLWFYLCDFNAREFNNGNKYGDRNYKRDIFIMEKEYMTNSHVRWYFENYKQVKTYASKKDQTEPKQYFVDCHKRCLEKLAEKSDRFDLQNKRGNS